MKFKCDKCEKPATVHLTEIIDGQKIEKHLCEDCAASEGITVKTDVPISQLLEEFILQSSGGSKKDELKCDVCGITFSEFGNDALFGCPADYDAFEEPLTPLLERAHEGETQHVGKVPRGASTDQQRQHEVLRLRSELKAAIEEENYEQAAELRDRIKELES
jgi:protein arginine kinase activator